MENCIPLYRFSFEPALAIENVKLTLRVTSPNQDSPLFCNSDPCTLWRRNWYFFVLTCLRCLILIPRGRSPIHRKRGALCPKSLRCSQVELSTIISTSFLFRSLGVNDATSWLRQDAWMGTGPCLGKVTSDCTCDGTCHARPGIPSPSPTPQRR